MMIQPESKRRRNFAFLRVDSAVFIDGAFLNRTDGHHTTQSADQAGFAVFIDGAFLNRTP